MNENKGGTLKVVTIYLRCSYLYKECDFKIRILKKSRLQWLDDNETYYPSPSTF